MATAAFSIAPVLTPQTIGALADTFEEQHQAEKAHWLRQMRPFVEDTVKKCFVPLVAPVGKASFSNRFAKLSRDFEPFRLYLNLTLVNVLGGPDFLQLYERTILGALDPLMATAQAMEMHPELIMATIRDYLSIVHALIKSASSPDAQTGYLTVEKFERTVDWFHAATRLDYGLTSIFLVLEMAIPRPVDHDRHALVSGIQKSILTFGQATAAVVTSKEVEYVLKHLETVQLRLGRKAIATASGAPGRLRRPLSSSRRQIEIDWIAKTADLADRYGGQWVVIDKSELIANDPEYRRARDAAKQKGIKRPFIFFVPAKDSGGFMGL